MPRLGGALVLIAARPSGAAMTVSAALEDDDGARAGRRGAGALEFRAVELAEQALELAFVRRQDHRPIGARRDRLEQRFGIVLEHGHGVGVEHRRRGEREDVSTCCRVVRRHPSGRADDDGVDLAGDQRAELGVGRERLQHDRGDVRGLDQRASALADEGHRSCPGAQRSRRGETRGARSAAGRPRRRGSGRANTCGRRAPGGAATTDAGLFSKASAPISMRTIGGNADVGEDDLAAKIAARRQQMAGLPAEERDGEIGVDRRAADRAARHRRRRMERRSRRLERRSC